MKTPYGSHRLLLAAALASAGVHAITALVMNGVRLVRPASDSLVRVELLAPDVIEQPDEIVLGIVESDLDSTPDWLGFAEPTPHQAPVSETAQSALTPDPAATPAVPDPPPVVQEPVLALSDPAHAEHAREQPTEQASVPIDLDELAGVLQSAIQVVRSASAGVAALAAENVRASARSSSAPGQPGEASDREADATAREEPIEVRPGRVAAAEGLEITTRRPQWRALTTMTTSPVNPVVRIDFGRDGRVKKAEFVDGRGTGFPDVDGPLLNAIITRWTAKGRAIDELSQASDACVSITMKIILNGPSI